jgi:hypothetical protein
MYGQDTRASKEDETNLICEGRELDVGKHLINLVETLGQVGMRIILTESSVKERNLHPSISLRI